MVLFLVYLFSPILFQFARSSDSYWVLKRNHQIATAVRRMLKGMGKYGTLLKSRGIITELSSGLFSQIQQDLLLDLQLDYFLRNHACQSRSFAKYGSIVHFNIVSSLQYYVFYVCTCLCNFSSQF